MEKFKVTDIANLLRVAQVTVYRKAKKLRKELTGHSFKEKGVVLFDFEGVEIIRKAISTAPEETTTEAVLSPPVNHDYHPLINRFGDMEKGILALADSFRVETKSLHESMARLMEENQALRKEVSSLRVLLPAPQKQPPAPKKEPTFFESFDTSMKEVQEWLRGVLAPFVGVIKG